MSDYFASTITYKVWNDVTSIILPKAQFLLHCAFWFVDVRSNQEGVVVSFEKQGNKLELIFSHVSRTFHCGLTNHEKSSRRLGEHLLPPKKLHSLIELEKAVDEWVIVLKKELCN